MNTGGSAFPGTMLDWMAGQALVGFLVYPYGSMCDKGTAKAAYDYASAMLAEKARREADHSGDANKMVPDHSPDAGKMVELQAANRELVEKVAETQAALDLSARQLLDTVNDRNIIGVQLDLLRDELLRIRARIGETGLIGEHLELSSIAGYCERAQKDIAVLYTPIQERDKLQREVRQVSDLRERAEAQNQELVEALKVLLCASEKVLKKGYFFAELDQCVAMARAALAKAKEAKP